jgi:O-antigen ligase
LPLFITVIALTLLGGFRSTVIHFILTFGFLFCLEGLTKTRMMPMLLLGLVLGGATMIPFTRQLPLSMQRALSFLPLPVDPVTKADAMNSTEWRLKMWQDLLPDVPKYLIVGKGYSINANEMQMVRANLGVAENAGGAIMVGDYHNGTLSVLITYGIFGMIAFLWFICAAVRVMYQNYKYGAPELKRANCVLLAYFLTRTVMFFFGAGALYSEMINFTGLIGLSVSLNGGVAKPVLVPQPKIVFNRFRLQPALREPVQAQ